MTVRAYGRASTNKQEISTEVQLSTVFAYAQRQGFVFDSNNWFVDTAISGKERFYERPVGKQLFNQMQRGDVIIVAKLDRLSRSMIDFAHTLDTIEKRGVILHICDIPGGVFDPTNPISRLLISILVAFAEYERRLIGMRTSQGLQQIKASGRRHARHTPFGMKWERRWNSRAHKFEEIQVEDPQERAIGQKCLELRAMGYSLDQIRQYLAYEWRVTALPRKKGTPGSHYCKTQIGNMIAVAAKWLLDSTNGEANAATRLY
jgi:DNA invertase Pin-like site-specific DNA recombinase